MSRSGVYVWRALKGYDLTNFESLGVSKPVIIGHGISHDKAFKNMLALAARMIEADLMTKMTASFTRN